MESTFRMLRLTGAAAIVASTICSVSAQEQWAEWRGPGRAGQAAAFKHDGQWPASLELSWRIPVGIGHSAPVVAGGLACLHSRSEKNEVVACYDLATGAEKWSRSYPSPFNTGIGGGHHEAGPKATPTLRDGRLFTFGISGVLSAWDVHSGELLWRRDFRNEYNKPWPYWGVAASPLVDDGRVYVSAGRKKGALHAIDAATGKELWRVGPLGSAYASPIMAELDGIRQIVAFAAEGLVGVSSNGELLWRFAHRQRENAPTPLALGDRVLIGSKGRPSRALRPFRSGDTWGVATEWENKAIPFHMSTAVAAGGDRFCGFTHRKKGFAFCAGTDSGTVIWRSPGRFAKHASVVSVPGALLFFTSDGRLRVLEDGDTYRELASYELSDGEVWAHPAILAGALVVKAYDELLYWRLPDLSPE